MLFLCFIGNITNLSLQQCNFLALTLLESTKISNRKMGPTAENGVWKLLFIKDIATKPLSYIAIVVIIIVKLFYL